MKIAEVLRSPRPGARLEPLPADQANCPFKIGDRVQPDPTHWKSGNQHLLKRAGGRRMGGKPKLERLLSN